MVILTAWELAGERTVDLARLNRVADGLRALAIDLATNAERSAQNLLHNTLKILGEGLEPHRPRNLDDLVQRDGLVVLDVLLLLAVAGRLLERPDDERRGRRHDRHLSLTVLDGEANRHPETLLYCNRGASHPPQEGDYAFSSEHRFPWLKTRLLCPGKDCAYPVGSGLRDIFTDLLRRQTERTDLRGEGRRGTHLTTGGPEVAVNGVVVSSNSIFSSQVRCEKAHYNVSANSGRWCCWRCG